MLLPRSLCHHCLATAIPNQSLILTLTCPFHSFSTSLASILSTCRHYERTRQAKTPHPHHGRRRRAQTRLSITSSPTTGHDGKSHGCTIPVLVVVGRRGSLGARH